LRSILIGTLGTHTNIVAKLCLVLINIYSTPLHTSLLNTRTNKTCQGKKKHVPIEYCLCEKIENCVARIWLATLMYLQCMEVWGIILVP
jgi:hypothetical protein